jgi:hypothetical protein
VGARVADLVDVGLGLEVLHTDVGNVLFKLEADHTRKT